MDRTKLKALINRKRERNNKLNVQIKYLEIVEQELSKTKFKRFFSTSYLIIKRFILITVAAFLMILGLYTYFNPEWIYDNTNIDEILIADTQMYYKAAAGETLKESLLNLSVSNTRITPNSVLDSIEYGFNTTIQKEVHNMILGSSLLSIFIGVLLLYLSRLTRKIRLRNKQLSLAEEKIKKILTEFKNITNSENNELRDLEDIYEHNIVGEKQQV